ncbi:MAG: polyhydroxyalkanoate depolymerase [Caenispirillum bisanense]|nr:polyhydroxyalkanoate depolymerase [Caenispirillum bisanense]MCA1973841.1 polyhydroxyalkanoate depolymerase [Caenispirillum sp.]
MLYQFHEFQHAAMAPMRVMARAMHDVYTHPWLPTTYTAFAKTVAASADMFERVTRKYPKPQFHLPTTVVRGEPVPVVEEIVHSLPFCDLLHFRREGVAKGDPRVLVVAPLSGHYATLLRGTVEALLPEHDVYITDWVNARDVPLSAGRFCLDTYVEYVRNFLHHLGPNTHVMAVCQPAVPVTAAAALMAEDEDPMRPASITLMGGPIDTRANPTAVNDFATEKEMDWFTSHVIHTVPVHYQGRMRKVYPGFLQLSGFMSMNMDRHMDAHLRYFRHLVRGDGDSAQQHRVFYDEYMSVMDLPAEFYLQTIRKVFKEWQLPRGILEIDGRTVDLSAVRDIAFMSVEGEKDDITGVGQTKAVHNLLTNLPKEKQRYHMQPKVGHYGIFNGRRWREEILPHVREFIRANDKALLGSQAA